MIARLYLRLYLLAHRMSRHFDQNILSRIRYRDILGSVASKYAFTLNCGFAPDIQSLSSPFLQERWDQSRRTKRVNVKNIEASVPFRFAVC